MTTESGAAPDRRYGPRAPVVVGTIENTLPQSPRSGRRIPDLPFAELDVGQSFTVSGIARSTLRRLAAEYERTAAGGVTLVVGAEDESGVVRIGRKA